MANHRPPCETWQEHVAVAVDRDEIGFRLGDFLDRFDEERRQEMDEIEPVGDNPFDSVYAVAS